MGLASNSPSVLQLQYTVGAQYMLVELWEKVWSLSYSSTTYWL